MELFQTWRGCQGYPDGLLHSLQDVAEKFEDGMPALFHRRNRKLWLVTMRLEDWMKLYGEAR